MTDKKSLIDTYLVRLSHLSQIGLLIVAAIGYFYTVVPLYQKALLDEEIARKEIELASVKATLEENYAQLRKGIVRSYISFSGAKCTGILRRPERPLKLGEKTKIKLYDDIFDIKISMCLVEDFKDSKSTR